MLKKKTSYIVIGLILFSLVLTACQYSMAPAEDQSLPTPTLGSDFSEPASTGDPIAALEQQATQNAALTQQVETPATEPPTDGTAEPATTEDVTPDAAATSETPAVDVPTVTPVPTTNTPAVTNPQPGTVPATYTLQKGEFPYCIARRYNLDPNELLALNSMTADQARDLNVGLVLKLPQTGHPFPADRVLTPHPSGTTYTVQTDNTIYSIACYFGDVDPMALASLNGLASPYTLSVGTVLNIP